MYLNVRQPPLRSKLPFSPFAFLFPRTSPSSSPVTSPTSPSPPALPSGPRRSPSPQRMSKRSSSVPIAPIPPSLNPRGELIFSSRVDRSFRESYERYRNAFERKREEHERATYEATWLGWITTRIFRIKRPLVFAPAPPGSAGLGSAGGSGTSTPAARPGSVRGRGSASVTPSSSRRSSPIPSRANRRTSTRLSMETGNAAPSSAVGESGIAEAQGSQGQGAQETLVS